MSADLYPWILIGHLIGDVLWVAGMMAVLGLLWAYSGADAASRPGLVSQARTMALVMDIGATLAIGLGVYLAVASPRFPNTAFKDGGWLHVKLTLVVLGLLGPHGMLRGRLAKFRRGQGTPVPRWVLAAMLVAVVGAVTLGRHPTLLRKKPPAVPTVPAAPAPAAPAAPAAG